MEQAAENGTIIAASIKGGLSKTRTFLCQSNFLGAAGYPVCVIDMDINNSCTFNYLPEDFD
jgi:cellulose biosynthesis protein BcsQ